MRLFLIVASILAAASLAACGSGSCSKACKHVTACDPNATCPLSAQCSEVERCQAKCISDTPCAELGGAAMQSCMQQCGTTPPPKSDGGLPFDGPAVWLDGTASHDSTPSCSCAGRQCGDDGCGNSCGTCGAGLTCNTATGQCLGDCTPSCAGKQCGPDGCGGSCGSCTGGLTCGSSGQCVSSCTPSCVGKQCGPDGCGGSCGSCSSGYTCDSSGQCAGTSGTNSGAICNASQSCSGGDTCLLLDQAATNGMCVASCTNTGGACPAPGGMLSACVLGASSAYYCAYLCKYQGTTYPCPSSTAFDCTVMDPTNAPDVAVCVPK